jgi:hypothetical protein
METFKYQITCQGIEEIYAWGMFIESCEYQGHPAAATVDRGYRVTLRPADMVIDEFIDHKLQSAHNLMPVWCLRVEAGYIFFGRL